MITSIRLQAELEDPLTALAERLKRTKNWLINLAIREFLEREHAEEIRWQETLVALQSVRDGRVVAEDEVHAWLESWGTPDERKPPRA